MKKFTAKKIIIFSLMILGVFLALTSVGAQGLTVDATVGAQSGLFSGSLTVVIARIINAALGLLGLVAIIIVIYGGYLYMTARGEAERVQKAKKLLIQAVIGLLIIASAYAITSFILYILTGGSQPSLENGNINRPTCIGAECGCTGPDCFKTTCDNPTQNSSAPWICSVKPIEQAKGGILTIRGGNFGSFDSITNTSKVAFVKDGDSAAVRVYGTILTCQTNEYVWNVNASGIIKVAVPDSLNFNTTTGANNKYKVYVENGGQSSIDYHLDSDFVNLRNIFTLTNKAPSPEIICINPDHAAEQADIEVIGKNFGTDTQNKIIFNKNIAAASVTSWATDLIKVKVPQGAIYGDAYIADKTTSKQLSDGENFWVTCSNTTSPYDCQSKCCHQTSSYAGNVCDLEKYCGGHGLDTNCNKNAAGAVCDPNGNICNAGLACDATSCKCRAPKVGDSCDSNKATPACDKDNNLCGLELVCDNNCQCQEAMQITAVTPGNGASGNYITISGTGFGQPKLGNNVIPNSDFSKSTVWWFDAYQPAPAGVTTSIVSQQLYIDVSKSSPLSWYYMFGLRNLDKILPNKTINTRYLLSFKYKGNITGAIPMAVAVNFGDNWPNITGDHMRSIGAPIPVGNYTDWQTFQGTFTYDSNMKEEFYFCVDASGALDRPCAALKACLSDHPSSTDTTCEKFKYYKLDLGFIQNPFNRDMKMYIDDFEVKEIQSIGTVTFCGADVNNDNDKCGDADDKIAQFPYEINKNCTFENDWQDNEILVVVPAGGVNGPIKVTTASGLSDQTAPAPRLPGINDFIFDATKRPALCGLSPNQGAFNTYVRANGNAFGTTAGSVYVGNPNEKKIFSPGTWSDQIIYNLTVPNFMPATLPVWIKVGNELSNPVAFKILPTANAPTIDSIDPVQGPTGQYITIQGSGFGSQAGTVKFKNSGTDITKWESGQINFPAECSSRYWTDTQIIIKVPGLAVTGAGSVAVITSGGAQSNTVNFNHCAACQLTPGICSMVPSTGPVGTSNVVIYGDNFGTYDAVNTPSKSQVIFFSDKPALNLNTAGIWTNKQIGLEKSSATSNNPIVVPAGATSGAVFIRNANGIASNKLNFEIADCRTKDTCEADAPCCQQTGACLPASQCLSTVVKSCDYKYTFKTAPATVTFGAPKVIENYTCDNELNQSPSPWKNPTKAKDYACVNSAIYARFDMAMDTATFTNDNVVLTSCSSDTQGSLIAGSCTSNVILNSISNSDISSDDFSVAPAEALVSNTWYQVTLKDNIRSAATAGGQKLDGDKNGQAGGNYIWNFKTGDSAIACPVDSVNVTPNNAGITRQIQTQAYNGRARAANCNVLSSNAYNWIWFKRYCPDPTLPIDPAFPMCNRDNREDAQSINAGGLARISQNQISGKFLATQTVTPLAQGGVYIGAEVDNKFDDTNILNINLNIPVINGFTPKDGIIKDEINSYVDIVGSNFGASQGGSKVYFEKANTTPACVPNPGETVCWTEATLANCGQAWTDTTIKVIVPKDVKDGAWIRIVTPFGEDNTDFNTDNVKDPGETFNKSSLLYPFICQLNPNIGVNGINVAVIGDNFGDKNIITFNNAPYGVGSYIHFSPFAKSILDNSKIKKWSNTLINYVNPLTDLDVSQVNVFITIDPYSEPYNDTNGNGIYDVGEPYADINNDGAYNKTDYTLNGVSKTNLESNQVVFSQPPTITRLSPNNGPVKQWVTIIGKNFGNEAGEVYFGDKSASLVPCETNVWTNDYIIAEVPEGTVSGNVYIITKNIVRSINDKLFTVNENPLGSGLCSLAPNHGDVGTSVVAKGVRFDDTQGGNNLVFANNVPVSSADDISFLWSDSEIDGKVPEGAVSGEVTVVKKVSIGNRCTRFSVLGLCFGQQTEVFQDAPSNGIYFTIDTNEPGPCNTDADCKKPVQITDPVTNEITATNLCPDSVCLANKCTPDIISMTPTAGPVGQWVDIAGCYLGCQQGKVYFGGVQALTPSDGKGPCKNTWTCSRNLNTNYDLITAEVPNKTTKDTGDDATTGTGLVTLQTSNGQVLEVGNFTVNTDSTGLGNQACKLETCGNKVLDTGEKCEITGGTPPYIFAPGYGNCSLYAHAPANCTLACNANCQPLVCNQAGACTEASLCGNGTIDGTEQCDGTNLNGKDCSSPGVDQGTGSLTCKSNCTFNTSACSATVLCGNGELNGSCSNKTITDYQTCISTPKTKNTWNGTSCSNTDYLTKSACEATKNTWSGEQCDCGSDPCSGLPACSALGRGNGSVSCNAKGTSNQCKYNYDLCDNSSVCGNGAIEAPAEDCDFDSNKNPLLGTNTCTSLLYGTGTLGCNAATCKFDASQCSEAPDTTPPVVEKTLPANGENSFCRNGIVDIYFSKLIDPATITQANFVLGSCSGSPLVKQDQGLFGNALAYVKNIVLKLLGYDTQALAGVPVYCSNLVTFGSGDYTVSYNNYIDATDNNKPKTVVYLELTGQKLFAAGNSYNVGIFSTITDKDGKIVPMVKDKAGNALDYKDSPLTITIGGSIFTGYAFGFATAGDPDVLGSGICDVKQLTIDMYRNSYNSEADRVAVRNVQNDLFRCAGKNDCALPGDFDQDKQTGGNQHIYKAIATAETNGFHLSVNTQWSRSDQSDPAKMLALYNKSEDTNTDDNIVQNQTGVVYATINPIADKENTSLLVVEAQARGSQQDPLYKIFKVDYLGCSYPWIFDRDTYGNSKIWYCQDAEPLLPYAGTIEAK